MRKRLLRWILFEVGPWFDEFLWYLTSYLYVVLLLCGLTDLLIWYFFKFFVPCLYVGLLMLTIGIVGFCTRRLGA